MVSRQPHPKLRLKGSDVDCFPVTGESQNQPWVFRRSLGVSDLRRRRGACWDAQPSPTPPAESFAKKAVELIGSQSQGRTKTSHGFLGEALESPPAEALSSPHRWGKRPTMSLRRSLGASCLKRKRGARLECQVQPGTRNRELRQECSGVDRLSSTGGKNQPRGLGGALESLALCACGGHAGTPNPARSPQPRASLKMQWG